MKPRFDHQFFLLTVIFSVIQTCFTASNQPELLDGDIISPPVEFIDTNERTRSDIIGEILQLQTVVEGSGKVTHHLHHVLLTQLAGLKERRDRLRADELQIMAAFQQIEKRLSIRAAHHVMDKYQVQISDIEKIVRLVLSVSSRLANITTQLQLPCHISREEKDHLEEKKGKLLTQLEETKYLWKNINRRTTTVRR